MKRVGAHVSAAGGVDQAPLNALKLGAKAFALWVKNSKQWFSDPFDEEAISKFEKNLKESKIDAKYVLPHGSYLLNLGSPKESLREMSFKSLVNELNKCSSLGLKYLNIHPGSHLKEISEEKCLENIAENINNAHSYTHKETVVVLEATAGQGSNVGYKFEHLAKIIENVEDKNRVGFCIDTCHIFAAGYDLRTQESSRKVFDELFNIIDIKYFKAMHLNDSVEPFGSKKDRHESLGEGALGLEVFKFIMNDDRFEEIPLILETPNPLIWTKEIEMLYSFIK